jgi:hypothetical protein
MKEESSGVAQGTSICLTLFCRNSKSGSVSRPLQSDHEYRRLDVRARLCPTGGLVGSSCARLYQQSTRNARSVCHRLGSPTDSPNGKASASSCARSRSHRRVVGRARTKREASRTLLPKTENCIIFWESQDCGRFSSYRQFVFAIPSNISPPAFCHHRTSLPLVPIRMRNSHVEPTPMFLPWPSSPVQSF